MSTRVVPLTARPRHPICCQVSVSVREAAEAGGGEGSGHSPQFPGPLGQTPKQPHVAQLSFQCGLTSEASGTGPGETTADRQMA